MKVKHIIILQTLCIIFLIIGFFTDDIYSIVMFGILCILLEIQFQFDYLRLEISNLK